MPPFKKNLLHLFLFIWGATVLYGQKNDNPFSVKSLFDPKQSETLGLSFAKGLNTQTVFSPDSTQNKYNHGVVLYPFKGMLYAQWQSSSKDEDAPDTKVMLSRSRNGKDWSKPICLTKKEYGCYKTSGGWWSHGDTLVAFINVWPDTINPRGGYTKYMYSTDGLTWSEESYILDSDGKPVTGVIEQDIRATLSGRLLTAFHSQKGLIASPYYTDDKLGIRGWKEGKMTHMKNNLIYSSREIEPSWFYRKDNALVMVFRDQMGSFKKLASISTDNGEHWTSPTIIDTPDSRSKQSAGNLPDGTAFMVNNPTGNSNRFPLAITLSKDGFIFDKAYLIRSSGKDMQAKRFEGLHKRAGYSYPKSVVWGKYLYIAYATNKEDIQVSRIPIKSLTYK